MDLVTAHTPPISITNVQSCDIPITVPCGDGKHDVTFQARPWGSVETGFNPCEILPPAARRLAGSTCVEIIDKIKHHIKTAYQYALVQASYPTNDLEIPDCAKGLQQIASWFEEVRVPAAEQIWDASGEHFAEIEWSEFLDRVDEELRWASVILLGARQVTPLAPLLGRKVMETGVGAWSSTTKWAALWSLLQIRSPESQDALGWWLEQDHDPLIPPVFSAIYQTLGDMGDYRTVVTLGRLLGKTSVVRRYDCEDALASLVNRRGKMNPPCFSSLLKVLGTSSARVVEAAQARWAALGEPALVHLRPLMYDPIVNQTAVKPFVAILGDLTKQKRAPVPLLKELLSSEVPQLVVAALRGLAVMEPVTATPVLCTMVNSDHGNLVRGVAAELLGKIGDGQALAPLLAALPTDIRAQAKYAVLELLKRFIQQEADVLPLVPQALQAPDVEIKMAAVRALETIDSPAAKLIIVKQCLTAEEPVAMAAAEILGRIGDAKIAAHLAETMCYGVAHTMRMAVEGLVAIGRDAVPILMKRAKHSHPPVRVCAIQALSRIGDSRCRPILQSAFGDANPKVQHAAEQALEELAARAEKY